MPPTWFFSSVPKRRKRGQCHDIERNYKAQNNVKGLESSHPATGWSHFEQYWSFLPAKAERWCPRLGFLVPKPKTSKNGPMPRPWKKLPSSEQCQRSQKFTSSYQVVLFRIILKFSAYKSWAVMTPTRLFSSLPKRQKTGQCHDFERNHPAQNNVKILGSSYPTTRWSHS